MSQTVHSSDARAEAERAAQRASDEARAAAHDRMKAQVRTARAEDDAHIDRIASRVGKPIGGVVPTD